MLVATVHLLLGWIVQVLAGTPRFSTDPAEFWPPPEPEFLTIRDNITVREGEVATLPCSILHLGTKQVGWKKIDQDYMTSIGTLTWVQDSSIKIVHVEKSEEVSDWNMVIKNVKPKHAGIYECQITTPEKHRRRVQLNVYGPPITEPDISVVGKQFVETGDDIRLVCNATGGPHIPEEIDWFKDGDKIDTKKYRNILITKFRSLNDRSMNSELIIDRATIRDTGTYICRSSSDEIDSIKVTVLHGDSTRNERGTPNKIGASVASGLSHSWMCLLLVVLLLCVYHQSCT